MKRLTWRVNGEARIMLNGIEICGTVADRLAAYEDTGLEPEEIELLAKQRDLYMDACGELPLKRIRELAQADREGRCFTSPVKIGQTVWFVRDPKRNPENIVETTVEKIVCKRGGTYMKLGCNSMYETSCNSIGKTVFLTREEAQAALGREQDG